MIRLMKYVKGIGGYLVCIVVLLFLQAYCDLSLPDYTANIVNVGIQQQGIEDGVPERLRLESMEHLKLFLNQEEREEVEAAYTLEDSAYELKKQTKEERASLNEILGLPMMLAESIEEDSEQAAALKTQMGLPPEADLFQALSQMPEEALASMTEKISGSMANMPDSIISQAAVRSVRAEYEALGENVNGRQMGYLLLAGLKMLGLALLSVAAAILVTYLSSKVAASVGHDLRNIVYRKVIGFSSGEFHQFSTASLITRSTNDIQQVQLMMAMIFRVVLYAPIVGIGGVLKVVNTNLSMTWILGLAVAMILLVVVILFSVAMPRFNKLQKLIDRLNLVTREILTGIPVIRAFSREIYEEERFEKANRDLMKTNLFVNRCMTFMMPVMMLIMNGVSVLIIYNGAGAVDAGSMQVGDVMAFIQYSMQIIMSFLMITMMSVMLPRANVSAKRICEVLDTKGTIEEPAHPRKAPEDVKGLVEFDHVSFAYPDAGSNVLEDITFTAHKGETVAFIGSTGSGKSTLINLIPRFYDVTAGSVRVDSVDVREMEKKDLRAKLGYVPQKGVLFSGTIASNISYGCPDASKEVIEKAAQIAQAAEFIEEKKDRYEAPIAQGGTNVSGGQKQRLSIARAIAKAPEILIFDDSFSALDYKTDAVLRRALKENTAETTTLIVAQRINTILHADRIIVLDEGRIAGQGTHKELMKTCEVYREIAISQLSEEELADE